jgi:hypothetical protein
MTELIAHLSDRDWSPEIEWDCHPLLAEARDA